MKNKRMCKILSIIMIFLTMFLILSNLECVFATDQLNPTTPSNKTVTKTISTVIGIAQVIAVGVAVIMLVAMAIKYMSSAPNEKAEIKKHAVVYIVGAVIVFGATGILEIIKGFVNETL